MGLRRILNYSLLGASCVAPEYSAPECYYYVDSAIRGASPPPPLPPIDSQIRSITTTPAPIGPGEDRRWSVQVSSNDYEPHVTLTFQIYRDVLGGPCVTSSTRCRSEIAFVRRRAEYFNSCGSPPCSFNVEDVDSYFSNLDQNRSSEGAVTWIDHIHPQTAVLPGGFVGVVWQDFRTDLPVGIAGDFILNSMVVDPIATGWFPAAVLVATEHPWSLSALWRPVNLSGSFLGDVFYPAVSQLHAHFFVPHMTNPSAPITNARASVWSPVSPEHEP